MSGKAWIDVVGKAYSYTVELIRDDTDVDKWNELISLLEDYSNPSHTFELPGVILYETVNGVRTPVKSFRGWVTSISTDLEFESMGKEYWGNISLTIESLDILRSTN